MSQQQLDKLLKIFERQPPLGTVTIAEERRNLDEGGARFKVPADVTLTPVDVDGIRGEWLAAPGARAGAAGREPDCRTRTAEGARAAGKRARAGAWKPARLA